jgi:hypothetical protein
MNMTQIELDAARARIRMAKELAETNETLRRLLGIDWEQRRYEIAKAAMAGIVGSDHENYEREYVAKAAVGFADALIEELKKKEL